MPVRSAGSLVAPSKFVGCISRSVYL